MNEPPIQRPAESEAPILDVAFLPQFLTPDSLVGHSVVVVDVLRATTTITQALHNGCDQVLPQADVESARLAHRDFDGLSLIGGERLGKIVEGFHQGNSPLEYTPDVVRGKSLFLTTTNGTVAMEHCRQAKRILIGAMINLSALVESLIDEPNVTIVCSGTDRSVTGEDVLFAGALVDQLMRSREAAGKSIGQTTDAASIAVSHWRTAQDAIRQGTSLAEIFRNCRGGLNLVKIGHDPDIVFASQVDAVPIVPELDLVGWSIRLV